MEINSVKEYILTKLDGLSSRLTYHKKQHTLDVLASIEDIVANEEDVDEKSAHLLKVAALMHDTGFLEVYMNHEEKGCEYAKEWLPQFGYSKEDIDRICGMIMATKIPHNPKDRYEQMMCDADLDYLGTDNYDKIAATLHKEWIYYGFVNSDEEWLDRQIGFLKLHRYYTPYFVKVRVAKKQETLERLEAKKAALD
ncbi:MAG: HD domain-containing protein [Schleiferiaceae bacterium]|jgi:predicted metal-dependent HD superfamily phosphohydrolase|nr:HD domain-containing protein [Schleiferiaceae bacterium]